MSVSSSGGRPTGASCYGVLRGVYYGGGDQHFGHRPRRDYEPEYTAPQELQRCITAKALEPRPGYSIRVYVITTPFSSVRTIVSPSTSKVELNSACSAVAFGFLATITFVWISLPVTS